MHGLDQSVSLGDAAVALSKARETGELNPETNTRYRTMAEWDDLEKAEAAYAAAYKVYTNPSDVVKTVDVRWPAVGAEPWVQAFT